VKCTAHRTDGQPCNDNALEGQRVCWNHGGATPLSILAAQTKHVVKGGDAAMRGFGAPVPIDPAQFFVEELDRTNGHVQWLAAQVASYLPQELVEGFWLFARGTDSNTSSAREFADEEKMLTVYAGAWANLYLRERKHGIEVSEKAIRSNVAERHARVAEAHIVLIGEALVAMIRKLGLDPNSPQVRRIAHETLTAIESAA
jgi:hypothetical protein